MPLPEFENSPEQYRESTNVIERPISVAIVECASVKQDSAGGGRLEHVATQVGAAAGNAVSTIRGSANKVYRQMRSSALAGYSQTSQSAQDLMKVTRRNAKLAREEYPVQTLAVLAGIGFVIGIALRIRRNHEPRNACTNYEPRNA